MRFRVSPARMGELKLSCLQQEKRLQEGNICCVRERKKNYFTHRNFGLDLFASTLI